MTNMAEKTAGKGSIYKRVRNINIGLFIFAFVLMVAVMISAFNSIIGHVSSDYASRYAASSADAFSANIIKELGLMSKAARSASVVAWLSDEENEAKKALAFEELSGIVGELYSTNIYIGIKNSGNEYHVGEGTSLDEFQSIAVFDKTNPEDVWFFSTIDSDRDYILDVAMDNVLDQKRVWVNYKVTQNDVPLGVISTGLAFSHVVGELFAQYDNETLRGIIIDENGTIQMDSKLLQNPDYLNQDFVFQIEQEFSDPVLLNAIREHLNVIDGVFEERSPPIVVELNSGTYRYATIAPIRNTSWSAVILYDPSSSVSMTLFLPIFAILLALLIIFALATNATSFRFIFSPLDKLVRSLVRLGDNDENAVFGIDRDDEIGNLSNTIVDLFTKANYDALTGIYNRRYMENTFQNIMHMLSRAKDGTLSVIMIDIDFFKKYNDTYGHDQGDFCLRTVAQTIAGTITRKGDFAVRYGGEEFTIILPNTDEEGARIVAKKLVENIRELALPHEASTVAEHVTISAGVTTGKVLYTHSWEDYIRRADEALYKSKQGGRDQYTFLVFENDELSEEQQEESEEGATEE